LAALISEQQFGRDIPNARWCPHASRRPRAVHGIPEDCGPKRPTITVHKLFPAFAILHFGAVLDPDTNDTPNAKKEAHQMYLPRWLVRLTVPVMVGAAVVTNAALAAADATDDAFLTNLHALGFTWPPDHDGYIVSLGHHICVDYWSGWTFDRIAQDIHASSDPQGINFGDVRSLVSAAEAAYCPS
jgi:Protein of unknown function (DUF732)